MTTPVDLRSDTVTQPTPAMREAMANAPVGDDVFGEDPTINALESEAASLLGKEAGLFVTSGTQGNLISMLTHCGRSDEVILAKTAHIYKYELGGSAGLGGLMFNTLDINHDGTMDLDKIERAIRPRDPHVPRTRVIALENTQSGAYGAPLTAAYTAQVAKIARDHDLKFHIDGARLFNAAAALNVPARSLVEDADSVTFCLSKGLCAPVGSVIVSSREFIDEARRIRKMLGGGMRQAGIIAAAGLIALREMTARLTEDHANARHFGEGLAKIPGISLDLTSVRTNMVFFSVSEEAPITVEEFSRRLQAEFNVLIRPYDSRARQLRAVTHYWVTREDIDRTLEAIRAVLATADAPVIG